MIDIIGVGQSLRAKCTDTAHGCRVRIVYETISSPSSVRVPDARTKTVNDTWTTILEDLGIGNQSNRLIQTIYCEQTIGYLPYGFELSIWTGDALTQTIWAGRINQSVAHLFGGELQFLEVLEV